MGYISLVRKEGDLLASFVLYRLLLCQVGDRRQSRSIGSKVVLGTEQREKEMVLIEGNPIIF